MVLLISGAIALVLWVVLWALGAKAFDALMLSLLIMILAAAVHLVLPYLPGRRSTSETHPDAAPYT